MADQTETDPGGDKFDPQFQTEKLAFGSEELIDCEKCGRKNGPNRSKCMYCGHPIVSVTDLTDFGASVAEGWEPAFNVVKSTSTGTPSPRSCALLNLDGDLLGSILRAPVRMPLARVASKALAESLCERLAEEGIDATVIADLDISDGGPPVRLSGIGFRDKRLSLKDFNTRKVKECEVSDLSLLVKGRIRTTRLDSIEKKGRRGKSKLLDEFATASDSFVLDLYVRDEPRGYRVQETGFDFSCLGGKKRLIASENMNLLCRELSGAATEMRLVDAFDAMRFEVNAVWPVEQKTDFKGLQRTGFGKMEFGSSSMVSNLDQFTKFSRLQWVAQ